MKMQRRKAHLNLALAFMLIALIPAWSLGQNQEENSGSSFWSRLLNRSSQLTRRQGPGFIGAKMLMVEFESDPKAIRAALPEPLEPGSKPHGFVFVAFYPKTHFGSIYHEGAVFLWARYKEHEGWYCLAMPVDDELAMVGGRRIGFPKRMSEITLLEKDGIMTGKVMFKGKELMSIKAKLDKKGKAPDILMGGPLMNLIPLNAADKPGGYAANAVLLKAVSGVEVHKVRGGTAELNLPMSKDYPLPYLPVLKIVDMFYVIQDVGIGSRSSSKTIRLGN